MYKIKFFPFYLLSLLPYSFLYAMADVLAYVLKNIIGYRRKVIRQNLSICFPKKPNTELNQIEAKFYVHFLQVWLESFKLLSSSKNQAKKRLKVLNPELLNNYARQSKNVILYMGHFGNWEWFAFLPLLVTHDITALYKPQSNDYIDDLFVRLRSQFDVECIPTKQGFRRILELKREGRIAAHMVIGDQSPQKSAAKFWVDFFGQKTAFLVGGGKMAKKLKMPVIYPSFRQKERGQYEVYFHEINKENKSAEEITQNFAKLLEQDIKAQPELWLWSHNRWKLHYK